MTTWAYPMPVPGSHDEQARRRPCPACGAPAGASCVSRTGRPTDPHSARIREDAPVTMDTPHVPEPPPGRPATAPTGPQDDERPPTDPALRRDWQRRRDAAQGATPDGETSPEPRLLGETVLFRSRTGAWTAPAVITATQESLNRENVAAGHVPDLASPLHVHLTVLTPGLPGHVSETTAREHPELTDPDRLNRPAGGSFQEWDIPMWLLPEGSEPDEEFDYADQPAGTWTWLR